MAECPACGGEVASGEESCPGCGAPVVGITESFPPLDAEPAAVGERVDAEGPLLVVRKGPELGERFYVDRPKLTLGRDPQSDIFLNDVTVSRQHAIVETGGGEVTISDSGSLNGTYVNGVLVDSARLRPGDVVQIGRFQMLFISGGERL